MKMKTILLPALVAVVLGVGSVGVAFADGGLGAGEDAQGRRPDVIGTRIDGGWSRSYGFYHTPSDLTVKRHHRQQHQ